MLNSIPALTLLQAQAGNEAATSVQNLINLALEYSLDFGLKILATIAVLIIGNWLAKFLSSVIKRVLEKREVEATVSKFVSTFSYYLLFTLVIVVALTQLGVRTASFVAVLGAAGLAIGLALQGSLSHLATGVLLIIFRPFQVGDFVQAGGATGIVESVELLTTTLKSLDNTKIVIPNSNIFNDKIVNYTAYPTRRVDLVFGIGYDDDIDKAREIIWQVLKEDKRILDEPAATVHLFELADSSVNFAVRPWVKGSDYWTVLCEVTETVKKRFDAAGINIPYPQHEVHVQKPNV